MAASRRQIPSAENTSWRDTRPRFMCAMDWKDLTSCSSTPKLPTVRKPTSRAEAVLIVGLMEKRWIPQACKISSRGSLILRPASWSNPAPLIPRSRSRSHQITASVWKGDRRETREQLLRQARERNGSVPARLKLGRRLGEICRRDQTRLQYPSNERLHSGRSLP